MGACASPSLIMGTVHYQSSNSQSNTLTVTIWATRPSDVTLATQTAPPALDSSSFFPSTFAPLRPRPTKPCTERPFVEECLDWESWRSLLGARFFLCHL